MKLYATIASERAKKGQGGNSIAFVLRDENERPVILLQADYRGGTIEIGICRYDTGVDFFHEFIPVTRGERQKGECVYHGVVNCSRCDDFKR